MQSLWNDKDAALCSDPLALRVYTSRLLGRESSLVLHGGGNTSLKATAKDVFGDAVETLYVKGSGWDLATIEAAGFAPVRMSALLRLAQLDELSDTDMVRAQRIAMLDPSAPNPSVEAILHALIPFAYVDHTHTDAVVTISNTPDGEARIHELFGERVLVIPYVMPGFILAKTVRDLTRDVDWKELDGMVLMHHGLFTFADDVKQSYEQMIALVSKAEAYLENHATYDLPAHDSQLDLISLATLRREVSLLKGEPMLACLEDGVEAAGFAAHSAAQAVQRGTLTPDYVIRTKPAPLFVGNDVEASVSAFADAYRAYFAKHADDTLTCLDAAPRWAV